MGDAIRRDPSSDWTAQEIEQRLGCSTIVFPRDRLLQAEDVAKMRDVGITRIEICASGNPGHLDIHNRAHITEIASQCEQQGVSIESIHSPDFPYNSEVEDYRKKAVAEGVVAARVAEEMGAGVIVCHFDTKEQSEKSITEMLDQLEGHSIKLAIENGLELADYTAFVDKIGSERLGMVVDIGHTRDKDEVNPFTQEESSPRKHGPVRRAIDPPPSPRLDRKFGRHSEGGVVWRPLRALRWQHRVGRGIRGV